MVAGSTSGDRGFVMIDVMTASAVLAIAGAAAAASMTTWVQQQNTSLDRSVETINFASFVETLSLARLGEASPAWDDGTFSYEIVPVTPAQTVTGLFEAHVRSIDRAGRVMSDRRVWLVK